MFPTKIVLKIDDKEYDIFSFCYKFHRNTDTKGRPKTGVLGGDILMYIESTEDNTILCQMLLDNNPVIQGSIEVLSVETNLTLRRIVFDTAYIYLYEELMQNQSSQPMIISIGISPVRLDIGDKIRLDRRWPETSGFWWSKYEATTKVRKNTKTEEEVSPKIIDAYWMDSTGPQRCFVPDMLVTLYIVLENANPGEIIPFTFRNNNTNKEYSRYSGIVDKDGVVTIENYKFEI